MWTKPRFREGLWVTRTVGLRRLALLRLCLPHSAATGTSYALTDRLQHLPTGSLPTGSLPTGFLLTVFLPISYLLTVFLLTVFLPTGFLPTATLTDRLPTDYNTY